MHISLISKKNIDYDLSFNAVGEKGTDGIVTYDICLSSSVKQEDDLHFDEVDKKM